MTHQTATQHAVCLERVTFAYPGADAYKLDIPDLNIDRAAHIACVGASGCGKSTLVHLIAGILLPDAGTVHLADTEVSALNDADRRALRVGRIGLVFQRFELLPYLSARENILLPYHINPALSPTGAHERARDIAAPLGIDRLLNRRPDRLSQGERQRVAIARALVTEPELILCDEPTGNLDPDTAGRTLDLLLTQARRLNATLLMVTHNHELLHAFDRVIRLPLEADTP